MKKKCTLRAASCLAGGLFLAAAPRGAAPQVVRFVARHSLGPVDGTLHPVAGRLTFDPASRRRPGVASNQPPTFLHHAVV